MSYRTAIEEKMDMSVRATKKQIDGRCGECAHGTYDMQFKNLSITGQPTLVICPFNKYKKKS